MNSYSPTLPLIPPPRLNKRLSALLTSSRTSRRSSDNIAARGGDIAAKHHDHRCHRDHRCLHLLPPFAARCSSSNDAACGSVGGASDALAALVSARFMQRTLHRFKYCRVATVCLRADGMLRLARAVSYCRAIVPIAMYALHLVRLLT